MVEEIPIGDREQWLDLRKQDVTASQVGALFGCHPYVTALRIYAEKRGTEFNNEQSDFLERRRDQEPAIARAVERARPAWKLTPSQFYYRDPDARLGATPDYLIWDDERGAGVLEIKTSDPAIYARDWLGGDEPPLWIVLQVATQMMLTNASFGAIAVQKLDARLETRIHEFERNPAAEKRIIARVAEFWQRVAKGEEPEPDFGRDMHVIQAMKPADVSGSPLDWNGSNEIADMLATRAEAKRRMKELEATCAAIDTELLYRLGSAEVARCGDWTIAYKMRAQYEMPARIVPAKRILSIRSKQR